MPIPRISGESDPMNYDTPYDTQESLREPLIVPPMPQRRFVPSGMVDSVTGRPSGGSYRDDMGNIYPQMPEPIVIPRPDLDVAAAQEAPANPLKPVSMTLAERVASQGAFRDTAEYMANVRLEATKLARSMGIDTASPDGMAWMQKTINDAKGAVGDFVVPIQKGEYITVGEDQRVFNTRNRQWEGSQKIDDLSGPSIQPPTIDSQDRPQEPQADVAPTNNIDVARKFMDKAIQLAQGGNKNIMNDPRVKWAEGVLKEEQKRVADEAKTNKETELKPTGEIQKSYTSLVNSMKGLDNLKKEIKSLRQDKIIPTDHERSLLVVAQTKPEGYLSARKQALARGLIDPNRLKRLEKLEAIKGALRSDITTARAGLSQTIGELANITPFTPQTMDDLDHLDSVIPELEKILTNSIDSSNKLYPSLSKSGIYEKPEKLKSQPSEEMVPVISPQGKLGSIPASKLQAALKAGFKQR